MSILFVLGALGALLSALLNWGAVIWHKRILEYIFKPLVMVFLLLLVFFEPSLASLYLRTWVGIALLCSLVGDVFLMLPDQRYFLPGLVAFLFAHVAYIAAFRMWAAPAGVWFLWVLIAVLASMIIPPMMRKIRAGDDYMMRGPVLAYALILSTMLFSTWSVVFRPDWPLLAGVLICLGGSFFYVSDVILAWARFVDARPAYNVAVIVTYHIAQILLVGALFVAQV